MNCVEAFYRNGVPDIDNISTVWYGKRNDGVLVVMAHHEFFKQVNGKHEYEDDWSHSPRNRDAIAGYEGEVILLVHDNTWGCGNQNFIFATGVGYRGRLVPGSAIRVIDLITFEY
jgi:hypothetical protein